MAVFHWAHAMSDGIPELRKATVMCLEAGDHEYYSYGYEKISEFYDAPPYFLTKLT